MKVVALRSFAARFGGRLYKAARGDVLQMPKGTDWVAAGLVEPVDPRKGGDSAKQTATVEPTEKATTAEDGEPTVSGSDPVTAVDGVGPATAKELAELGVETVADLAAAENLPAKLGKLQEAAQELLR